MRILLDTHIWIWYLSRSSRLSETLREIIENAENQLYLSPISIWETLLLGEKKRIILAPNPEQWVKDGLQILDTIEAPLCHRISMLSRRLHFVHEDPADRFIAATAVHYDLCLATVDEKLTQLSYLKTLS